MMSPRMNAYKNLGLIKEVSCPKKMSSPISRNLRNSSINSKLANSNKDLDDVFNSTLDSVPRRTTSNVIQPRYTIPASLKNPIKAAHLKNQGL